MNYIEPVFRPPSEWKSYILQVTNGCSWNKCTFCEMYTAPEKAFEFKSRDKIQFELQLASQQPNFPNRIFLADGDALTLSIRRLSEILSDIKHFLPRINRVTSYCLPRNLNNKSVEELASLRKLGLKMVYVGCESGDDEVLKKVNKGESFQSSLAALQKLKAAGIKASVMILNGLGGTSLSKQHAINSAKLMNAAQPEYLSTLVVSFPMGEERFKSNFPEFNPLTQQALFQEMQWLLSGLDLEKTIFRSDHASNYLVLKGILGQDKDKLLAQVNAALTSPQSIPLRQEWQRGL
ncbi:radical SAM protein [Aliikangiella coralliicola]|uniref:B12-binding domain-containing radical SAM protein n=1 Tax=Aliikangiella coralliicola TaxID=2592383 RepID=A0A545UJF0_9GAMM|nr:radical SAM protein [Aliikangiella coralliicola]TQV89589.1 B12-binding domain-containing radical SAM protein [Aliikangiella coralliicola]